MTSQLADDKKKELFRLLVETQDSGATVVASRQKMADQFGLSVPDVVQVEREGIANNWPPLDISFASPELLADQATTPPGTGTSSV